MKWLEWRKLKTYLFVLPSRLHLHRSKSSLPSALFSTTFSCTSTRSTWPPWSCGRRRLPTECFTSSRRSLSTATWRRETSCSRLSRSVRSATSACQERWELTAIITGQRREDDGLSNGMFFSCLWGGGGGGFRRKEIPFLLYPLSENVLEEGGSRRGRG